MMPSRLIYLLELIMCLFESSTPGVKAGDIGPIAELEVSIPLNFGRWDEGLGWVPVWPHQVTSFIS